MFIAATFFSFAPTPTIHFLLCLCSACRGFLCHAYGWLWHIARYEQMCPCSVGRHLRESAMTRPGCPSSSEVLHGSMATAQRSMLPGLATSLTSCSTFSDFLQKGDVHLHPHIRWLFKQIVPMTLSRHAFRVMILGGSYFGRAKVKRHQTIKSRS